MFAINTQTLKEVMVLGATGLSVYVLNEHNKVKQIHIDDFKMFYRDISNED